ncbi:putative PIN family toxin of toxin-antitoxin system [Pedobacter sp. UYP30]|uniref:putative toxin-antitoxin system toxin component, PIN family n=1 Tax=Pedobacter sp. UYP30 TaxID=1756400 RepID=UPI003393420E
MMQNDFFVFDTNTIISAALIENTISNEAIVLAINSGKIAVSISTLTELAEVLFRKKFDKYFVDDEERWKAVSRIELNSKVFVPTISITDCRDPKDNKFLELAVASNASCLITGDQDLLVLNPFRDIAILNAADFIDKFRV